MILTTRIGACLAALMTVGLTHFGMAQTARPPNIVLIMADDLGRGHCGSYGQTKIRTPNIDSLAAQGMKFNQFYAGANVCAPSRSVLMTGLHTGHTPVRNNGLKRFLSDEDVTIAEVFRKRVMPPVASANGGSAIPAPPGSRSSKDLTPGPANTARCMPIFTIPIS